MSVLCVGTSVGFVSKPYDLSDKGGPKGVTHTLTVSTGDATEAIKVPENVYGEMSPHDIDKLRQFGRPLVVRCSPKAQDSDYGAAKLVLALVDVEFVRMADLATFGYTVDVYVEDDEPSANGHTELASV